MKELGKYDKVPIAEQASYAEEETESYNVSAEMDKSWSRQLMLVYLVFLAEA